MEYSLGIDVVHIPKFAEKIKDAMLLKRLFTDEELSFTQGSAETLAGMYAAKEAYFKAIKEIPSWHALEIGHEQNGAPYARGLPQVKMSVSHDGEYAMAAVIISGER